MIARSHRNTFADLFTPKLLTVLREGYGLAALQADAVAGLTVAIVALPLSMAIAIASGVTPDRGLDTAIIGGFLISALGGSRFQIGGPAGAFIVLVAATVAQHGVEGLILATMLSGLILLAVALLRLGTFIKYIPYPVTVGFTAGIAVIIAASQIRELLGLTLNDKEPGPLVPKLQALGEALPTTNPAALVIAALTIGVMVTLRRLRPNWPGFLIAVALASVVAAILALPIATIGTRFGGIPGSLPRPHLPDLSVSRITEVLPAALSFALLGGIESLLSAVVADSMTGARHRSNAELAAQGVANMASALFGGFCVTGTIARTATNVRAGARGPLAGMLHAVFLLVFILVAAPLASYIPLAALAAVLVVVAWNMAERHEFATLLRTSWGDAAVLLVTSLLVVFRDLTEGIIVGFGMGAVLFIYRMSQTVDLERSNGAAGAQVTDDGNGGDQDSLALATDRDVIVYRISGAFFFATAAAVGTALDRMGDNPEAYVIDVTDVPLLDSTAAATIQGFACKASRRGAAVYIAGARPSIRRTLLARGVRPPLARYRSGLAEALEAARSGGRHSAEAILGRTAASSG